MLSVIADFNLTYGKINERNFALVTNVGRPSRFDQPIAGRVAPVSPANKWRWAMGVPASVDTLVPGAGRASRTDALLTDQMTAGCLTAPGTAYGPGERYVRFSHRPDGLKCTRVLERRQNGSGIAALPHLAWPTLTRQKAILFLWRNVVCNGSAERRQAVPRRRTNPNHLASGQFMIIQPSAKRRTGTHNPAS